MNESRAKTPSQEEIADRVSKMLSTEFGLPVDMKSDAPLFSSNLLDSTNIIHLILWIEETWGYSVPTLDVTFDNFDSIQLLSAFLSQKLQEKT